MTVSERPSRGASASGAHRATTASDAEPSIGDLVSEATSQISTLVHAEIELAKLELRSSVRNAGVGVGMFGAAATVLIFAVFFGCFALAEGLTAAGLWRWLSFLIVFGMLLVGVVFFALLGVLQVKRVRPPKRTITTSRETVAYLRDRSPRG